MRYCRGSGVLAGLRELPEEETHEGEGVVCGEGMGLGPVFEQEREPHVAARISDKIILFMADILILFEGRPQQIIPGIETLVFVDNLWVLPP